MEQKMHKRILSFIEEERLLSGDERICVDIFRRLKKNRSYLPSLHAVVELAKSFNCSADFLLGLSDFPDSADENIDVNSFCKNLNRFAKLHPTKFYLLKKTRLLQRIFLVLQLVERKISTRRVKPCKTGKTS